MALDVAAAQKVAMSFLDLNSDGKISRRDFELLLEKINDAGKGAAVKKATLKMCDALGLVGDASFTYEAYRKLVAEKLQDPKVEAAVRQVLQSHFDVLDEDGCGHITLKEYRVFMEGLQHADPSEAEAAFKSIDTSGNGKIERAEWTNYAFEYFFTAQNDLGSENMAGSRCCCCCGYYIPPPPPRCGPYIGNINVNAGGTFNNYGGGRRY